MCTQRISVAACPRRLAFATCIAFLFTSICTRALAQRDSGGLAGELNAEDVRSAVMEVTAAISREYMDPVVGERVAGALRRRLTEGQYLTLTRPDVLAA